MAAADSAATALLTPEQGFRAMTAFLEAYWARGDKASDDIGALLGSLALTGDGRPVDMALWHDWFDAIQRSR